MKLVASFDAFLSDVVNLNDTRIDQLDSSFEAIKSFIRASEYSPKIVSFFKHGSWAHKTIIKPVEGNPFDADVILFVKPVVDWEAVDYINELARIFRSSPTYKDKVRTYSHCVTIEYAGDRKMDIAPCVVDRDAEDTYEVCNRISNKFQRTEPEKYTTWLIDKNGSSGKNSLRKVTRLFKYLRDIKRTFTCPSFLLTTLIGLQIRDGDKDGTEFSDLPTALKTLAGRLDDWLQARADVPVVSNPVLSSEDQASGWTEVQYTNFRDYIHRYRGWIDDAYGEADAGESVTKWQKVFGDDFGKVRKSIATVEARVPAVSSVDEVDLVRKKGLRALDPLVLAPSWRVAPPWQPLYVGQKVTIRAKLVAFAEGRAMPVTSGMAVEPEQTIQFWSLLSGLAPGPEYITKWRITNTGAVARRERQLRGEFNLSDSEHTRQEQLSYRGVHQAEAFIIRASDQRLVGFSEPFYVVIE
ncbi:hypothetical protein [Pseudoxanthomonas sp.]|jgi:hypothetical protein|uniref:SMODS domain-containing nucleotidyltransferase n=1 Tax=Pseudoxanthomonas sp. TaxID=1871049 RepID=UPI0028C44215|nr:hypothetical protein [Pseudoxanthomonas sp.]